MLHQGIIREEAGAHPYTRGLAALRGPRAEPRAGGEKRKRKRGRKNEGGEGERGLKEKEKERVEVGG